MKTLLIGNNNILIPKIRDVLNDRGHEVSFVEQAECDEQDVTRDLPHIIILSTVNRNTVSLCRTIKRGEYGEVITILAVLSPGDEDLLQRMLDAGADECLIESVDNTQRLHVRLAFAERNVRGRIERNQVKQELKKRIGQQSRVADMAQTALANPDPLRLAQKAAQAVSEMMPNSSCYIWDHLPDEEAMKLLACHGVAHNVSRRRKIRYGPRQNLLMYATMESDGPLVVEDYQAQDTYQVPDYIKGMEVGSSVTISIPGEHYPYGFICVFHEEPRRFRGSELDFLNTISSVIAGAIRRERIESALRESETRARTILETTVDGIITIDTKGRIESFNPAAEKLFGYRFDEVQGQNVKMLMPTPYYEEHDEYLNRYLKTGERRIIGIGREVHGRRKDGSVFPMYLAVSEFFIGKRRMFTGIVRDITEQRRLEQEILRISEHERQRIGQDLHDGLGQMLTGLGLMSGNLASQLENEQHGNAGMAREITDSIKEADKYARSLSRTLVPVEFEAKGLSSALERLAQNTSRFYDIDCRFEEHGYVELHNSQVTIHIYRLTQEAVTNAVKHGRADRVRVALAGGEEQVRIRIQDNGTGFPDDWNEWQGMGVRIMQFRANLIGGTLDISSTGQQGTVITCTLPMHQMVEEPEQQPGPYPQPEHGQQHN